jgi:hypothetical protein
VLTLLGAAAGTAVSFTGYVNLLELAHPAIYAHLQRLTTPFVTAVTEITGRPAIVSVNSPAGATPPPGSPYLQFDAGGSSTAIGGSPTVVTIVSPRNERAALSAFASADPVALKGQVITVMSDQSAVGTVPILYRSLRMPITLHRGMNQIVLGVAGATASQLTQVALADLRITH